MQSMLVMSSKEKGGPALWSGNGRYDDPGKALVRKRHLRKDLIEVRIPDKQLRGLWASRE